MISNLFHYPQLVKPVAKMIHDEFWVNAVDGMSVADLVPHLKTAKVAQQMPLSLIALVDGEPAGCVDLIENDDEKRAYLRPWLAAMVVRADLRGRALARRSSAHCWTMRAQCISQRCILAPTAPASMRAWVPPCMSMSETTLPS